MTAIRENQQRAKTAIIFIYLIMFLVAVSAISSFLQYQLLSVVRSGGFISETQAADNDLRETIIAFTYLIMVIVSAVFFIRWFRRAYFNLHLRSTNLRFSEGWAAGSWFVPFMNLYAPFQIMSDLFNESFKVLKKVGKIVPVQHPTYFIVAWWVFWLLHSLINTGATRLAMNQSGIEQLILSTNLSLVANLLNIASGFFVIQLILRYAKIEPLLNDMTSEIDHIGEIEQI